MTDIIERLFIESRREPHEPIWRDAMNEIKALRAEVAEWKARADDDCTELHKRGWRLCAKGQQTTQWCQMAEEIRRAAARIYLSLPAAMKKQLMESHRQDVEIIVGGLDG